MIGELRRAIMDEKDRMLLKARIALRSTRAILEKILDDDDDAVLSAKVIGEVEGEEAMENQNMDQPEDRITMIRRTTFERISRLCEGRRAPEEAQAFYEQIWWSRAPASIREDIYQYFRDPRRIYPELPTMGTLGDESKLHRYGEDTVIRLVAIRDIILLMEALRREDPDLIERVKRARARYEGARYKDEKPIERMRRLAFAQAEEISGKPAAKIAKVFDRIDWGAIRKERFAELEELLFVDVQQLYEREPTEPEARKRWWRRRDAAIARHEHATEALRALILIFEHLRAEIANWHHSQSVKAAEKLRLERNIERARRQIAAHDQAA